MTVSALATAAPPSRRWLTLAIVALAQLIVVLDATVVNIALPWAQADLGFSDADRQWVVTSYSLTFASLLLLGGRLSDLVGRRRMFLIGLVGFAGASALGGAAQTFGVLIAGRALQGVFAAVLAPTALAVLTTTFTIPKERSRAFGVFGAVTGTGGAVGLLLGGLLTEYFDWRWTLYVNCIIAVVAIVGALLLMPALHRSGPRPKLDVPGSLLAASALFCLVYGLSNAEAGGWTSGVTWAFVASGVLLLVVFVLWERRAAQPLLPLDILRDRNRSTAYASVMIAAVGMFGVFLFVTYYVQMTLEYSPIETGAAFLPMVVMLALMSQIQSNILVPRFGPKVTVPVGMLLCVAGMVLLTRLGTDSSYAPDLLVPLMLMGAGMGTIMPASMQTATLGIDRQYAGVAGAMVNTSQQVGATVGIALLNTLAATAATTYLAAHEPVTSAVASAAAVHSYAVAYWWGAGFFMAGAVLAAVGFRRHGQAPSRFRGAAPARPGQEHAAEPAIV